jgi:hypothetical protein
MKHKIIVSLLFISAGLIYLTACNDNVSPGFEDSLELFTGLEVVEEASSSVVTINRGSDERKDGWFQIEIENIESNPFVKAGETEAWCLEWKKPLRSRGDVHNGVKWYSTETNDKWKPLNYFFSIRDELQADDPDFNNREIQAVIWVLSGNMGIAPEFDVLSLPVEDLPRRLVTDGVVNIDRQKVAGIAETVMNNHLTAPIELAGMVGQTADDEQDVFIPPAKTEFTFDGPMFDIAAVSDGGILVADFAIIKEIRNNEVSEIISLPFVIGESPAGSEPRPSFFNGLHAVSGAGFFASREGLDEAIGAGLFFSDGNSVELVSDIGAFTRGDWPEGNPGQQPEWKNFGCEVPGGFTAAPYSNPYHLTALSDSEVLLADAGANSLLNIDSSGNIEIVATFNPVSDPETDNPLVLLPLDEETDCFVEPVPTAVTVGSDGDYYVSELTGSAPENFAGEPTREGLASIWKIKSGSRDVSCPSENCTKAVSGLNSVIDIEFGPDGYLYVVEFEKSGFLAAVVPDLAIPTQGGALKKCDTVSGTCDTIEENLVIPGAIVFDKWDNLWLLENVFAPTVRLVN